MTFRPVTSLQSASKCERPPCIPHSKTRTKGKKYAGLLYERQLARALPSATHGQWFQFLDASGPHYCQPDFLISLAPKSVLILEAKLKWCREAHDQLSSLYIPVVERALDIPCIGVVVCKHLTPGMNGCAIFTSFRDLLHASFQLNDPRGRYVVHWIRPPSGVRIKQGDRQQVHAQA